MQLKIKAIEDLKSAWHVNDSVIALWMINTKDKLGQTAFFDKLSNTEKLKATQFRFQKDRDNFILGRGALREIIGALLKLNPLEIIFSFNAYGKPYLADYPWLFFNVSHADSIVVLGFSKNDIIGVDVERIKNDFDVLQLAQSHFSDKEYQILCAMPEADQLRAFYRCWTRKESFIKAQGDGLAFPLKSFTFSMDDDHTAKLIHTHWDSAEKSKWSNFSYVPLDNYIGAIAVRKKQAELCFRNWI